MFISEQQLFELKYRLGGKYYNKTLAEIFNEEFGNFNANAKVKMDLMAAVQPFYHKILPNGGCLVKFDDSSMMYFHVNEEKGVYSGETFGIPDKYIIERMLE